jgi:hypothetical protein
VGDFKSGKFGFIDKMGKVVITPKFFGAFYFKDGMSCVKLDEKSKWGFIDKTGKIVIDYQFEFPVEFENGLAYIKKGSMKSGQTGYIDKKGNFIWKE